MTEKYYPRRTLKGNDVIRGADRTGFQGPKDSLVDIELAERTHPRVERPAVMIETLRFVAAREGADPAEAMTAKSHALYEYLMASARLKMEGPFGQEFQVSFAAAKEYLGIDRTDRLREYVSAINETMVTYDFRIDGYQRSGVMPLLLCDYSRHEESGDQYIVYSIHRAVQQVLLSARRYALLELNAFRKFKSKYTARLYPRLALLAGQNVRSPLEVTPEELALQLGWTPAKFHFGNFFNRVLQPIMDDINPAPKKEPAVRMFRVEMNLLRGTGRGSPVEMIQFVVHPNKARMRHMPAAKLHGDDAHYARRHIDGLEIGQSPAVELVAQAVAKTGRPVGALQHAWAETIRALDHHSNDEHPLRTVLIRRGVGEAFTAWIDDYSGEPPPIHDDVPPTPRFEQVAAAALVPAQGSKAERMKEYAIDVGYRCARMSNNIRPATAGMPEVPHIFSDGVVATYADPEMWTMLEPAGVKDFALIQKAFRMIARQESTQMRKSLYNLGGAISEWDIEKALRIARAVVANPSTKPTTPIQVKSSPHPVPAPKSHELEDEEIPF